jgi:hypothetical protein
LEGPRVEEIENALSGAAFAPLRLLGGGGLVLSVHRRRALLAHLGFVTIGLRLCFGCHAANRNGQRGGLGRDAIHSSGSEARSAAVGPVMGLWVTASLECKLRINDARYSRQLCSVKPLDRIRQ